MSTPPTLLTGHGTLKDVKGKTLIPFSHSNKLEIDCKPVGEFLRPGTDKRTQARTHIRTDKPKT